VNLRKNEALVIELKLDGKMIPVLVTPGIKQTVTADSFQSVQIESLVARGWLKIEEPANVA